MTSAEVHRRTRRGRTCLLKPTVVHFQNGRCLCPWTPLWLGDRRPVCGVALGLRYLGLCSDFRRSQGPTRPDRSETVASRHGICARGAHGVTVGERLVGTHVRPSPRSFARLPWVLIARVRIGPFSPDLLCSCFASYGSFNQGAASPRVSTCSPSLGSPSSLSSQRPMCTLRAKRARLPSRTRASTRSGRVCSRVLVPRRLRREAGKLSRARRSRSKSRRLVGLHSIHIARAC